MINAHQDVHRRELPPLATLASFLIAVETSSFSEAGARMALTQSAISRQIALLEDWLQVRLFERNGRRVVPTAAALAYADAVRPAVDRIRTATRRLIVPPEDRALTIATLPSFGMRWLAPRLPGLSATHPEILVNFAARSVPFDFSAEGFDAAIHFGRPDWPGARHELLFHEEVVPVCSPEVASRLVGCGAADLLSQRLLFVASRADAWQRWFRAAGVQPTSLPEGPVYEQFMMLAHAAAAGMGVALIPRFLVAPEIATGALIVPFDTTIGGEGAYYLVWPHNRPVHAMFDGFRDWLLGEAARG